MGGQTMGMAQRLWLTRLFQSATQEVITLPRRYPFLLYRML